MQHLLSPPSFFEDACCPLLVGEAPGKSSIPERPIVSSRSGARLAELLHLHPNELAHRAIVGNLLDAYPGPKYPIEEAACEATAILNGKRVAPESVSYLLLLGRGVARAFGLPERAVTGDFFSAHEVEQRGFRWTLVVVPHPSGLSRWWNDSRNVALATRQMRALLPPLKGVRCCYGCDQPDPEPYMVTDELWAQATRGEPTQRGLLCVGCLERRLNRLLRREDFTPARINAMLRLGIEIGEQGR